MQSPLSCAFLQNCYSQKPGEPALDTSYTQSAMQESGSPYLKDKDQPSDLELDSIFGRENRKPEHNNLIDEMLLLKESAGPSFHNQDYVEKMKEFQLYVDKVKRFTRPGCSAEALNVALSSMSSLVNTLSAIMSSKHRIIHASL